MKSKRPIFAYRRLEEAACLVSFAVGSFSLFFAGPSMVAVCCGFVLYAVGVMLGVSAMRKWKRAYRNAFIGLLLASIIFWYWMVLTAARY
ncbi:MAG: hypothetical protein ABSF38_15250 [Verrucomicrobiota bacterium]|jgi:hypothetical protein